ncbi:MULTISPECIES: hypothetical protein [Leptolyngbya]|nr:MULTISPECIES: hypothetical protein [Leptolyngbya]
MRSLITSCCQQGSVSLGVSASPSTANAYEAEAAQILEPIEHQS